MYDRPFQVGDRVFALEDIDGVITEGATGTIVLLGGLIGVGWDHTNDTLHNCGNHCPENTGWFVFPEQIARIAPSSIDPTQFLSLLKGGSYA